MGSQCRGPDTLTMTLKLHLSRRHMLSFLSFASPSGALPWEENQTEEHARDVMLSCTFSSLCSAWFGQRLGIGRVSEGRLGLRGCTLRENLVVWLQQELSRSTAEKLSKSHFGDLRPSIFLLKPFSFSFWEKELILPLWEQLLNNFWKPLFPAVLPGISNSRGLFK